MGRAGWLQPLTDGCSVNDESGRRKRNACSAAYEQS